MVGLRQWCAGLAGVEEEEVGEAVVEEEIMTTVIIMITNRGRCWRKTGGGSGGQTTPVSGRTREEGGVGGWGLWGVGGGQQAARMEAGLILLRCHCASQRPSPLLSGYRNDAELCLLPTSWTGLIAGWVVVVGKGGSQCRLCLVLLAKRRPSATAESNRRGPSGLSGLGH